MLPIRVLCRVAVLAVLAPLAAAPAQAQGDAVKLKVADTFPPKHYIALNGTRWWMQRVEELSGGQVKFEYFGAGQLGKIPDMLGHLERGVADVAYVPPAFNEGKMPLSSVHNLPNLFSTSRVGSVAFLDTSLNTQILAHDYLRNGMRLLWGVMTSPYNVFTRSKPVKSIADLKGLKLKSAGGYADNAARALGIVAVDIPSPETYQAIQLGTVDGAIFPTVSARSYRLDEVAKHALYGLDMTVFFAPYAISERVWQKLTPKVREALQQASREAMLRVADYTDAEESKMRKDFADKGLQISVISAAEKAEVKRLLDPLYAQWTKEMEGKGLPGRQVFDHYAAAIKKAQQ